MRKVCLTIILFIVAVSLQAQFLAFPDAEGYGKYTTGGRGGCVLTVTTLNDNGIGSFREAVERKGPRIVVFAVDGTIEVEISASY